MTINWSSGVLNSLLAPGIAQFNICELPDLKPEHPQAKHWLSNHFLNNALRAQFGEEYRQYVFNLLFRAQTVFAIYHEARDATLAYLAVSSPNNPTVSRYFDMISRWESCLLNVQIFIDILNKIESEQVFAKGDDSVEDRAYGMANVIKHWGGQIVSGQNSGSQVRKSAGGLAQRLVGRGICNLPFSYYASCILCTGEAHEKSDRCQTRLAVCKGTS